MKPIKFYGHNVVFGENQPEYQPLPALKIDDSEGTVYTCWELTPEEIERVVVNGCIYLKQLTFNQPLQPILPIVELGDDVSLTHD